MAPGRGYDNPGVHPPLLVLLLSVGLIAWWLVASTRKAAVVPSRGGGSPSRSTGGPQLDRQDVIGSHDFLKFVPLLFTMFT